jgi:CRP-like cAMP-binding protein
MPQAKPRRPEGNAILASVGDSRFQSFLSSLRPVELESGEIVARANEPCSDILFPVTGVLSIMSVLDDGVRVGSGIVGNEGFAPLAAFHGADRTPEQVEVHVPGLFLRMSVPLFQQAVAAFPELRNRMHLFSQYLFSSVAHTSGCDRRHGVRERCSRLLLNTHDRAPDDEFALTHERLAMCLGVRRASITVAADELRRAGAIDYRRGHIRVADRGALIRACCGCYLALRETGERILQPASLVS